MDTSASHTPSIKRRMIVMVYETFLLLAVEMLAVVLWLLVTQNRHGPLLDHGRTAWLFLVTGAYFIHAWTGSGHTLAMKTWRMRLAADGHARVPLRTAVLRYLLAWGWFAPALLVRSVFGLHGKGETAAVLALGVAAWALTALFDSERRFLHDRLAGTRLVSIPKPARDLAPTATPPAAEAS
jgi:uncharacterized RDD family membrane protein YckC